MRLKRDGKGFNFNPVIEIKTRLKINNKMKHTVIDGIGNKLLKTQGYVENNATYIKIDIQMNFKL